MHVADLGLFSLRRTVISLIPAEDVIFNELHFFSYHNILSTH